MTIIACVRTGAAYDLGYLIKMRNMIARHMHVPYRLVCLTDRHDRCEGVEFLDVTELGLAGGWAKLILFAPEWRAFHKVVYCDLDTVIVGDVTPLAGVPGEFAILENETRRLGLGTACKYNSSVLVIGGGQCGFIWSRFDAAREDFMQQGGDQKAIEDLYPSAPLLQTLMPAGFFCNHRHLTDRPPRGAAVINFGGSVKPHNCQIPWVRAAWS
jgi:hypothetical protein